MEDKELFKKVEEKFDLGKTTKIMETYNSGKFKEMLNEVRTPRSSGVIGGAASGLGSAAGGIASGLGSAAGGIASGLGRAVGAVGKGISSGLSSTIGAGKEKRRQERFKAEQMKQDLKRSKQQMDIERRKAAQDLATGFESEKKKQNEKNGLAVDKIEEDYMKANPQYARVKKKAVNEELTAAEQNIYDKGQKDIQLLRLQQSEGQIIKDVTDFLSIVLLDKLPEEGPLIKDYLDDVSNERFPKKNAALGELNVNPDFFNKKYSSTQQAELFDDLGKITGIIAFGEIDDAFYGSNFKGADKEQINFILQTYSNEQIEELTTAADEIAQKIQNNILPQNTTIENMEIYNDSVSEYFDAIDSAAEKIIVNRNKKQDQPTQKSESEPEPEFEFDKKSDEIFKKYKTTPDVIDADVKIVPRSQNKIVPRKRRPQQKQLKGGNVKQLPGGRKKLTLSAK